MPHVTIKTGIFAADGQEEVLTQYMCDWPDCPNVAEHLLGVVPELRSMAAVCQVHATLAQKSAPKSKAD